MSSSRDVKPRYAIAASHHGNYAGWGDEVPHVLAAAAAAAPSEQNPPPVPAWPEPTAVEEVEPAPAPAAAAPEPTAMDTEPVAEPVDEQL